MRLPEGNDLHLQFTADGKLSGNAGCNRFFGEYQLDGNGLAIGQLGVTEMACPEPAMSLEISFMEALIASRPSRCAAAGWQSATSGETQRCASTRSSRRSSGNRAPRMARDAL